MWKCGLFLGLVGYWLFGSFSILVLADIEGICLARDIWLSQYTHTLVLHHVGLSSPIFFVDLVFVRVKPSPFCASVFMHVFRP